MIHQTYKNLKHKSLPYHDNKVILSYNFRKEFKNKRFHLHYLNSTIFG